MMGQKVYVTPELEAAAHRMAAASSGYDEFYMSARHGMVSYLGVKKDGEEGFFSLIRGEWTEVER